MSRLVSCALVAFLLGIGAHSIWPWTRVSTILWIAIAFGVAYSLLRVRRNNVAFQRDHIAFRVLIVLAAFLFGLWRFDVELPKTRDGLLPWVKQRVVISGKVNSIVHSRFGSSMIVRAASVFERDMSGAGRTVSVKLVSETRAPSVGSLVEVRCWLRPIDSRTSNIKRRLWLARRDIWTECFGKGEIETIAPPRPFDVVARLAAWRGFVTARIESVLPREEATLLAGILYGDQQLSEEQRDLMRRAGLIHLVAVSGSNVTIVVQVLFALMLAIGCHRRHAFWMTTIGIAGFLGFVGFSASVVRAGIMGWLVLLARHLGREASSARLLLCTACILVLMNPWLLAFDPGFALSFLATWGLLVWTPLLKEQCRWIPSRVSLRDSFATTMGATIMTIPYLAWAFGQMSLAGIITNVFALPLVPLIMFWGSVAAIWGPWYGSHAISLPVYGLLFLLQKIARLADVLPWLDLRTTSLDIFAMFAMYLCLFRFWRLWRDKTDLSTV